MSRPNARPEGHDAPGHRCATACFSVSAAADPGVMPRIMGLFAKRGMVPSQWASRVSGPDMSELQIDLQMDGLAPEDAELFAQAMRQVFPVERVLTSFKQPLEDARS